MVSDGALQANFEEFKILVTTPQSVNVAAAIKGLSTDFFSGHQPTKEEIQSKFNEFDQNNSGSIDKLEFSKQLKKMGKTPAEIDALLTAVPGRISLEAFEALVLESFVRPMALCRWLLAPGPCKYTFFIKSPIHPKRYTGHSKENRLFLIFAFRGILVPEW